MNKLIQNLKKNNSIKAPEWAKFVKTGAHKERPPVDPDWWTVRTASILKKIEKFGPIGTNRLSKMYGGRKNRGHKRDKKYNGSRNIVRKVLQQLSEAGLIRSNDKQKAGKVLTKEGKELLKEMRN